MLMNEATHSLDDTVSNPDLETTSYVLCELEIFNWGPFAGMHRASIDPRGTAVIGPTGSGKTTLIDGLMTLLVLQPRYNLASTGGHESDRTLISYVRGVLGGDGATAQEEVVRSGSTYSGLCATYRNNTETLRLGAVLWTEGSSNAAADLKRRWLFSLADDESLESWLRTVHEDGVRDLMRHGRETAQLRIFESKKAYLAHVRKFFDVGANAFTLLNRAAGLKQLNSIDEIFRDLVLEDRSAFDRALEVAGEFDNLVGIHAELETARRQQETLQPIATEFKKLLRARKQELAWLTLKRIVPVWFAIVGEKKWAQAIAVLVHEHASLRSLVSKQEDIKRACAARVETRRQAYLQLGGHQIGEVERTIDEQRKRVADRVKFAKDYQGLTKQLGLDSQLTEAGLHENQAILNTRIAQLEDLKTARTEKTLTAMSHSRDAASRVAETEAALRRVQQRPGSNIPPDYQDFRAALAARIELREEALPFVAELVEVKSDENAWRGAIERAIGPERLRVLVPQAHIDAALDWINSRDNKVHVRLLKAPADPGIAQFLSDGFTRKLNFKEHPLREAMKVLLASRDRHCVSSPQALAKIEHAMTVQGLMSNRAGRFEKQDHRPLKIGWMTGFDNSDQLRILQHDLTEFREHADTAEREAKKHQRERAEIETQVQQMSRLLELDFASIDLPGAELDLKSSMERRNALLDPASDTAKAKESFEQARDELDCVDNQITELKLQIAVLDERRSQAQTKRDDAASRIGQGLSEDEQKLALARLPIASDVEVSELENGERKERDETETKLATMQLRVRAYEHRIVRDMERSQRVDTGALAEVGTELADVPDYLERLRVLNEEALPGKLDEFLSYLNRSSDQGVTQLLAGIAEEVDGIEQRIAELNRTLSKVDFRSGRYLQLKPQRIRHERIRSLEQAQRHLRSAALKEDNGDSHYKALRGVVEILREAGTNRRQMASRALLDPRYRLQFFVLEVDRITGSQSTPRTGSQSGSGGEKELMASHVLTASLSYALCPSEASRPLYGSVVLDEAFSKSSPSAATRIIEALRIFGLHPIFVTPNKELGLLKKHTRRVICVQRPLREASLASISWERLEALMPSKQ